MADVGGPVDVVGRMAVSDTWGGPFAEHLHVAVRMVERDVAGWGEHLARLHGGLDVAAREAENTARLEAMGIVSSFDLPGALAPWRRWPTASPGLPADWAAPGQRGSVVWVFPDRARQLAEAFRQSAEPIRAAQRRVAAALAEVGIDTPLFLRSAADGLDEIAAEIDRRVTLLEQVDKELAGAFRGLADRLGFPGSLAPPCTFDPADPITSSQAGLPPPAEVGPGRQTTQAVEADPVSTSTGNFLYHVTDLSQPARGLPTVFTRTYNSLRAEENSPIGFGWSHRFGVGLVVEDEAVRVVWDDGREDRYLRQDDGTVSPPGVFDRLVSTGDGWELTTKAKVVFRFEADGRLAEMVDRSGVRSILAYDDVGRLTRLTDGSRVTTDFEYDRGRIIAVGGVLDRRWTYGYSEAGDLVSVTDPEGAATILGYDGAHRLVEITDPEGRRVVRNRYDDLNRVVAQEDAGGGRWCYRYEPGRTVVVDPLGYEKTFVFDDRYRTSAVIDANGVATHFAWDQSSNLLLMIDATRRTARLAYDARGNLTSAAGAGTPPVSLEWDDDNLTAIVSGEGHRATFAWDGASRPARLTSAAGNTTEITWTDDGLPEAIIEGDGATTSYRYDERGHLASVTDPLAAVALAEFDAAGRPVAEVHPGGERTTFTWDRADRLTSVTDAAGGVFLYAYDGSGRLVSFSDPLGDTTRYGYDGRGLLESVLDPLERRTSFAYDPCGRLAARTDPRGINVSFTYDPAGRLLRIEAPGVVSVSYQWDAAGRMVSMTDETGTTTWELDKVGRPITEHRPAGIDLLHGYDALGRRDQLELRRADQSLGSWKYGLDPDGRIASVLDPGGGETLLGYDDAGRLISVHHPNQTFWTAKIDLAGQPVAVTLAAPDGQMISSWTNTFDDNGNRIRSDHIFGPAGSSRETTTFVYDELGRLVAASKADDSTTYSWDAASNLLQRAETERTSTASFDAADQIATDGGSTCQHDDAGNLTEYRGHGDLAIEYDSLGRPRAIRADGRSVGFGYDGLGRRVARSLDGAVKTRVFDGMSVIAEFDDGGELSLETTAGLLVLNRRTKDGPSYLHPDANTNIDAVTDETAAVVAQFRYAPFGGQANDGDAQDPNALGFCGALGVRGEIGGLLDMRARLYDPTLGRFTSPDPWPAYLPEPITLNRYLYALGDPVSQVDPFGLFCLTGKNDKGKCRGLKDVTQRVGQGVAKPLEIASTVFTGVAAISVGVSALCPFPCGIILAPVAGGAESLAIGTGLASGVAHCAADWSFTSFDCAVGIAEASIGSSVRRGLTAANFIFRWSDEAFEVAKFGGAIFTTLLRGSVLAGSRKDK
jgi:RHS repeat-associated protein